MATLIKIGDKVRIRKVGDRGQEDLTARVGTEGIVMIRRVVDGSGVGYFVEFPDKTVNWFFDTELDVI